MKKIKELFRLNHVRSHFLRFGFKGILFYFQTLFSDKTEYIVFKHKQFKFPIYLRQQTTDISAFYQIIFNLEYQVKLIEEPKTIIDLGANIGLSSVYFKNQFPNSKVIAVEAEKGNYQVLLKNVEKYSELYSYNNGIWPTSALLEIQDNGLGNWGFSVSEVGVPSSKSIEAISLEKIIDENNIKRIDILKIDIEGSEIELFQRNYKSWLSITKVLIIELHDWMREGCSKQFFSTLVEYDFNLKHKGENYICYLKN